MCILFFSSSIAQDSDHIQISEFMAANQSTLEDMDGDFSDWIELYNPTDTTIHLKGWYISDNPNDLIKWIFPDISIEAHGYLVLFASGKDRRATELHTNFKLSSSGEWIVLTRSDGISIEATLDKQYPEQHVDISYGLLDGEMIYMDHPTPAMPNEIGDILASPTFNIARGFFESPFMLEIHTSMTGDIKYTVDGSEPGMESMLYFQALEINSTTVVRAIVQNGNRTSAVATSSYIFPEHVSHQPKLPEGYSDNWGSFSKIEGQAPADYEMDPDICFSPQYKDLIQPSLLAIPTISITTKKSNLFSLSTNSKTGGIYIHTDPPTGGYGEGWERPVSVEYVLPDGISTGFQVNCGIRIHGGHSRVPEKNPKHSFRLVFRDEYGPKELKYDFFGDSATSSFNSIILRAGFNQTWNHWDDSQREKAQYINDSWAKDMYAKMGHLSAHNKFVHLYLNGLYWGLYNLSERMDDDFMEYYLDGDKAEFDVIKDYAEVAEGTDDAWNTMMRMAENGLTDAKSYYTIQGKNEFGEDDETLEAYLDVENLVDYMILNFYAGNKDWDHHNWVAVRNRNNPGKGFQFIPWDSERIFNQKSDNVVGLLNENRPSFLFGQLRKNPAFRMLFAKRANELLGSKGLLSPDSVIAKWNIRSEEIELAIIAESARWGDYRRDVHPYKIDPYQLYTKNDFWLKEQKRLIKDYFPNRSQIVLDQLKAIGLAGDIVTDAEDASLEKSHFSYPNPFNKSVTIAYNLQVPGIIQIDIYFKEGKVVSNIFSDFQDAGSHQIEWKPRKLSGGLYFYKISSRNKIYTGKMIFVK